MRGHGPVFFNFLLLLGELTLPRGRSQLFRGRLWPRWSLLPSSFGRGHTPSDDLGRTPGLEGLGGLINPHPWCKANGGFVKQKVVLSPFVKQRVGLSPFVKQKVVLDLGRTPAWRDPSTT